MSADNEGCIICAYPVCNMFTDTELSWLREFRIVYTDNEFGCVTGIGLREDNASAIWLAPSAKDSRWDDCSDQDLLHISLLKSDPHRGFLLHDACFRLLQQAHGSEHLPYERLIQVCQSLPSPLRGDGLSWDHDSGGLLSYDKENFYPWEDNFVGRNETVDTIAKADPFKVPSMRHLLKTHVTVPTQSILTCPSKDYFSHFPLEIIEMILAILPTKDALNLRLTSKVFSSLLQSRSFWKSRFTVGGDRNFLFEVRDEKALDYASLYYLTAYSRCSAEMKNRRRIWLLLDSLLNLMSASLAEDSQIASTGISLLPAYTNWTEVMGDVGCLINFFEGCRVFGSQEVCVPRGVFKIGFAVASIGTATFITGIRLQGAGGLVVQVGYSRENQYHQYELTDTRGFILAMGSRGVHALKIVFGDESLSEWIGNPLFTARTSRLVRAGPLEYLKISFDGYKIVGLGVSDSSQVLTGSQSDNSQLRKTAIWYPDIPHCNLILNENSFSGEHPLHTGYRPIFWIHFGGEEGRYLKHIVKVSFLLAKGLYGLEVHYDTALGLKPAKLGRFRDDGGLRTSEFPIDGAGGEIIETINITLRRNRDAKGYAFVKHGVLTSIEIITNRNRSICVGKRQSDVPVSSLSVANQSTLTGLYATQHQMYGLISLGVISEIVNQSPDTLVA